LGGATIPKRLTSSDLPRQKFASDAQPSQSTGTAWAAISSRPWFNLGQEGGRSSISGSIGETALGTSNKSLTAGFKRSW
jgi:hypothetical protein